MIIHLDNRGAIAPKRETVLDDGAKFFDLHFNLYYLSVIYLVTYFR